MENKTFDQLPADEVVEKAKEVMVGGEVAETSNNLPALLGGKLQVNSTPATIRGMENHTSEDFLTPTISLIQGMSKAKLADGKRPTYGNFFFSDTQTEQEALAVCILHKQKVQFDNMDGEEDEYGNVKKSTFYKLIVVDVVTGKPYQMFLKAWTHAREWKKLNTDIVQLGASALWEFPVRMTSEEIKSDNGHEWNVVKMQVANQAVSDDAMAYLDGLYETFSKQEQPRKESYNGHVDSDNQDEQSSGDVDPNDIPF